MVYIKNLEIINPNTGALQYAFAVQKPLILRMEFYFCGRFGLIQKEKSNIRKYSFACRRWLFGHSVGWCVLQSSKYRL
jgi:hypothetical protein